MASKSYSIHFIYSLVASNIVADNSTMIELSSDGNYLYVGDQTNNRLKKYTTTGTYLSADNISLGSAAVDILWISGAGIFATDGNVARVFDEDDQSLLNQYSNVYTTSGIAYDGGLNYVFVLEYYVLQSYIRVYDGYGVFQYVDTISSYGNTDMASHPDRLNQLYLANGGSSGGVEVYNYTGSHLDSWPITGGFCNYVATATRTVVRLGFPTAYYDNIYAVSYRGSSDDWVFQLDSSGNVLDQFNVSGDVKGIDVDSSLNVYILNNSGDLLKFAPNN